MPALPEEVAGGSCGADSAACSTGRLVSGPAACEAAEPAKGICPSGPGCTAEAELEALIASVKDWVRAGGSAAPGWLLLLLLLLLLAEGTVASDMLYELAGSSVGGSPLTPPAYGTESSRFCLQLPVKGVDHATS